MNEVNERDKEVMLGQSKQTKNIAKMIEASERDEVRVVHIKTDAPPPTKSVSKNGGTNNTQIIIIYNTHLL